MAALLDHADNICAADLGVRKESAAHSGGIQYSVDMAELYGVSAALGLTAVPS